MEVIHPSHKADFDPTNSARSSPHATAPSTPRLFYFSAPTSPSHLSQFYKDFDDFLVVEGGSGAGVTTPKSPYAKNSTGDDFTFDVSEEWETGSQVSAEEMFDGGMITPFNPPPAPEGLTRLPILATKKNQGAFSSRWKNRKGNRLPAVAGADISHRGRPVNSSNSSKRRVARSLSPIKDSEDQYWEEDKQQQLNSCSLNGSRKWKLKDLFLFRSASEGHAAEKDHLKKYMAPYRHSSFRAIDIPAGPRKGPVSAHELHYTMNRAVSQELKKKTFLPYKQGILGRLAFNPAVHALANGFGFSRK